MFFCHIAHAGNEFINNFLKAGAKSCPTSNQHIVCSRQSVVRGMAADRLAQAAANTISLNRISGLLGNGYAEAGCRARSVRVVVGKRLQREIAAVIPYAAPRPDEISALPEPLQFSG